MCLLIVLAKPALPSLGVGALLEMKTYGNLCKRSFLRYHFYVVHRRDAENILRTQHIPTVVDILCRNIYLFDHT